MPSSISFRLSHGGETNSLGRDHRRSRPAGRTHRSSRCCLDLLASPRHRHIQRSTLERLVLEHLREHFEMNDDLSLEEVRRIQIEVEPVQNGDCRTVIVHLLTDEEPIDRLTFHITREEDAELFDAIEEKNLYFLQGVDQKTILYSVEHQLKRFFNQPTPFTHRQEYRSSLASSADEFDVLQKMFDAYAHRKLTAYSRDECMRIALQYGFHDLLDTLDSKKFQTTVDDEHVRVMINEVQTRLHSSVERRRVGAGRRWLVCSLRLS